MKKILSALVSFALVATCVFALEVTDNSIGGTDAVGAQALNRALVLSGTYDIAEDSGMDGTNIVKLLAVPAGILPTHAVLTPADISVANDASGDAAFTLYRKVGTGSWAAVGNAQTVTEGSEVPILYTLVTPTYANTNAANVGVAMTDYDTPVSALSVTEWGFVGAVSGTNELATAGTITISVIGYDVDPAVRD